MNVKCADHFEEKMRNDGLVIEAAARSLLSVKYGEKYRYSVTISRLPDLALKFAETKLRGSANPANIATLD